MTACSDNTSPTIRPTSTGVDVVYAVVKAPPLPTAWVNSLDRFQRSEIVRGAFGAPFQDVFSRLKHAERSNFERIVTPLDHLWYSRVA